MKELGNRLVQKRKTGDRIPPSSGLTRVCTSPVYAIWDNAVHKYVITAKRSYALQAGSRAKFSTWTTPGAAKSCVMRTIRREQKAAGGHYEPVRKMSDQTRFEIHELVLQYKRLVDI